MSWMAVTLFRLRSDRPVDSFRTHSLEFVRPEMMKMPSVLGFRDFIVTGTLDGKRPAWDAVELIEVTDPDAFRRDNGDDHGTMVAQDWLSWVEDYHVLFCQNLAAFGQP